MCLIFNCSLWTEEGKKWGIYTSLPFTPKEDQRLWLRRIPGELLGQGLTWTRLSFGEAEKIKPVLPGMEDSHIQTPAFWQRKWDVWHFLSTLWTTKTAQAPFLPLPFYLFSYCFHNLLAGRVGLVKCKVWSLCMWILSFNLICCLPIWKLFVFLADIFI